jgi:hypothetical protein
MTGKEWFHASTQLAQTSQELHVLQVYNDPDFQSEMEKFSDDSLTDTLFIEVLTKKYFISVEDIKLYSRGLISTDRVKRQELPFMLRSDGNGHWNAWINKDITKEEYLEMWEDIKRFKLMRYGKEVRKRPPDNPQLIYAIFKQRQKSPPVSFGKITKMYKEGKLPNYNGGIKKSTTIQNLTREYNRYKPDSLS